MNSTPEMNLVSLKLKSLESVTSVFSVSITSGCFVSTVFTGLFLLLAFFLVYFLASFAYASLALQIYQYRALKKVSNSESALEKFCEQIKNGVAQSQIPIINHRLCF
jgi:uncharacterized protein involved in exopolysaccharide biosynthesis